MNGKSRLLLDRPIKKVAIPYEVFYRIGLISNIYNNKVKIHLASREKYNEKYTSSKNSTLL